MQCIGCGTKYYWFEDPKRAKCPKCGSEREQLANPIELPQQNVKDFSRVKINSKRCIQCGQPMDAEAGDFCTISCHAAFHDVAKKPEIEKTSPKETVCEEADRLIHGEKRADYGDALTCCSAIAAGWTEIINAGLPANKGIQVQVKPEHVGLMMAWLKIVRESMGSKRDNAVDLAGYAGVHEMIKRAQGAKGW